MSYPFVFPTKSDWECAKNVGGMRSSVQSLDNLSRLDGEFGVFQDKQQGREWRDRGFWANKGAFSSANCCLLSATPLVVAVKVMGNWGGQEGEAKGVGWERSRKKALLGRLVDDHFLDFRIRGNNTLMTRNRKGTLFTIHPISLRSTPRKVTQLSDMLILRLQSTYSGRLL